MVVAATCAAAHRVGLHAGMRLAQAQAMVPDLELVPATPQADADALAELAGWCRRYTPLARAEPPDGIWLDLTGCAHLFGGEAALLAELAARLRRSGLSMRVAIAATPGAAHAMARHGPDAAASVPDHATASALAVLPVEALRLEPQQAALLRRFGLRCIGELDAVARGPLARRLGTGVIRRLDQALGRAPEPISPGQPDIVLQERLGFAEPLQTAESLAAANALLAGALCRRLEALCLGARRLELVHVRLDGSSGTQTVALARPSHAQDHIARLLDERLERVDPGEGVETMWLLAALAEPVSPLQSGLAAIDPDRDGLRDLAPLIDRLHNRLGSGRIWRAVPVESDVPERSVRRRPPLDAPARGAIPRPASWPEHLPRPVRLFDPPQPVQALAELPDQPPVSFTWRGCRHRVRHADGPERIAGEWWQRSGEMLALRDYFRVEDEDGRRFWLFRRGDGTDLATGDLGWFLHGLF